MSQGEGDSQAVTNAVLALKVDRFIKTLDDHGDRITSLEKWRYGILGAIVALLPNALEAIIDLVST